MSEILLQTHALTKQYGQKKAVIANTFPRQDITNAYDKMAAYGEFCYNCLLKP